MHSLTPYVSGHFVKFEDGLVLVLQTGAKKNLRAFYDR
jgi:hypothetical protein